MDKTKIIDLKEKIFLRSALVAVDNLEDIFSLNERYSGDKLLGALFLKALKKFEQYYPLVHESKISLGLMTLNKSNGYYEIKSNMNLFHGIDPKISEDLIILVPNAIPKIRLSSCMPMPSAYTYPIDYKKPFIHLGNIVSVDSFYLRGLCNRPLIIDYKPDGSFDDTSMIYWMNIEEGILGECFVDQCMIEIFDYVRSLKANLTLPNMSVDIFGAVDVSYQQLKAEVDNFYLQSSWRGELLV